MTSFQNLPFQFERSLKDDVGRSRKRPLEAYKSAELGFTSHTTPLNPCPMSLISELVRYLSSTRKGKANQTTNMIGKKKGRKRERFMCRVECNDDMAEFAENAGIGEYVTTSDSRKINGKWCQITSDVIVEFESTKSLDELRKDADSGVDLHVLKQTLQPIGKYTGERDYNL